jgi:hypothetical protein
MSYRSTTKNHPKNLIRIIVTVVVALGLLVGALEALNITHFFHERTLEVTASPATKGPQPELNSKKADTNKSGNNSSGVDASNTPSSTVPLETPNGIFVSNHRPNLSGSPAPNQINSVCTTTSGASCTIVFTNGSVIKSLPLETTDSGGSAYWTWKLQDIGLTEGTWKVQAKATLGSQTKTANDLMDLVVKE